MTHRIDIPPSWRRGGLVLQGEDNGWGGFVVGDPCIVRDEENDGVWRMFLFALPPGHWQATCGGDPADPSAWRSVGPLCFTNPEILDDTMIFKPFVVLDAARPGYAARFDGLYALLLGTGHHAKVVRRAWSSSLAGPWTIEPGILIDRGSGPDFDAKHVDAASAWLFADRNEILYFYMGYPMQPQGHPVSPLGSGQGAAVEDVPSAIARSHATMHSRPLEAPALRKLGCVLRPSERRGHWASGWVGGLQLLCGSRHRWLGLVNASPCAPREDDTDLSREEPPPSLGGFAVCDEEFPVSGWHWCDAPLEWPRDVPDDARSQGEIVNFWRHHAVVLDDGRVVLFYNAGDYFHEKLFLKVAPATQPVR